MSEKKIAIVVQRCVSPTIDFCKGGVEMKASAEVYALQLGEALSQMNVKVDIDTSQSDDYIRWNNKLPSQEHRNENLTILRFPVQHGRKRIQFAIAKVISVFFRKIFSFFYKGFLSSSLDYLMLKYQGPWSPALWQKLNSVSSQYDLLIVKCYLYAPNVYSILKTSPTLKKLFIVTAHNETEFYSDFVKKSIQNSHFLGFVSRSEKDFCKKVWPNEYAQKPTIILPPITPQKSIVGYTFSFLRFNDFWNISFLH